MGAGLCGSWLACDSITSAYLKNRGACIAGKPGSHNRLNPSHSQERASASKRSRQAALAGKARKNGFNSDARAG